jgi:hypothetical protein
MGRRSSFLSKRNLQQQDSPGSGGHHCPVHKLSYKQRVETRGVVHNATFAGHLLSCDVHCWGAANAALHEASAAVLQSLFQDLEFCRSSHCFRTTSIGVVRENYEVYKEDSSRLVKSLRVRVRVRIRNADCQSRTGKMAGALPASFRSGAWEE